MILAPAAAATRKTGIDHHRHDEIGHVPDLDRLNPQIDRLRLRLLLLLLLLLLQTQPTSSFKTIVDPAWPGCVKK
jgi:hypothetical protein